MIKYTANDIVVRARQLADLENSDFISWNENINLLNECWQKIYQQLIDNGDKTFIKEIVLKGEQKIKIPKDFYELFSVELFPSCRQVHRKAKSESEKSLSYDIENDWLVIYGIGVENIRIKYLPIPQTLTLKGDTLDIDADLYKNSDYSLLDCYKNRYLYAKNSSGVDTVAIYSAESESEPQTFEMSGNSITKGVIGKRNSFAVTTYNGGANYKIWVKAPNSELVEDIDISEKGCLLKRDGDVGMVKVKGSVVTIKLGDKTYSFDISQRVEDLTSIGSVNIDPMGMATFREYYEDCYSVIIPTVDDETKKCGYVQLDVNKYEGDLFVTKTVPFEGFDFGLSTDSNRKSYLNVVDGNVCLATKDYFYIEGNSIFSFDDYSLIGVNEINEQNGRGIAVKDIYNTDHILSHSAFIDTVLAYPNNVYFNFMSVLMAISYKVKQNGDITLLSAKLTEMENQYFDTLSRDVNNVVRITNVY